MTCDVADAVDDLRQLIARAEALATAAEGLFDNVFHVEDTSAGGWNVWRRWLTSWWASRSHHGQKPREGHYRWLAAQGWKTLQVHRAAAADPDAAIAAWGSSQLAPSDGVFR